MREVFIAFRFETAFLVDLRTLEGLNLEQLQNENAVCFGFQLLSLASTHSRASKTEKPGLKSDLPCRLGSQVESPRNSSVGKARNEQVRQRPRWCSRSRLLRLRACPSMGSRQTKVSAKLAVLSVVNVKTTLHYNRCAALALCALLIV